MRIDPWGSELAVDLGKLFEEFGLKGIDEGIKKRLGADSRLIARELLIAHRDLELFLAAAEKGKEIAVMSGIKPSGDFHLGSKLTADELIFYQKKFGAKVFYAIADLEAYADNGLSLEESKKNAISNVADLLALGLDAKNAYIYRQSQERRVMAAAHIYGARTTMATLKAIYGERSPALYMSVLLQVGDILLPQHKDFGGPKQVLVPVGLDQDPHMRFARDIAFKEGLMLPASTYHVQMKSLKGETKMSKRDPMGMLTLSDDEETAAKKLKSVFTGGRNTAEEQHKLGGEIQKCVFYEICKYHFIEDEKKLSQMKQECVSGKLLCGECKAKHITEILGWLKTHQAKKKKMMKKAQEIVEAGEK
jgi:tryptophanyl-tRNA synthetase